jgi:hypothetical protein
MRYLGVARLKGLSPQELVEAVVWEDLPGDPRPIEKGISLIELLRQLSQAAYEQDDETISEQIPEELLVASFLPPDGNRKWIFGHYRSLDDVVLHAIQVPIQAPDGDSEEALETWLFKNRLELAHLYQDLRRSTPGQSTPLSTLRGLRGFLACFLAAPHRAL